MKTQTRHSLMLMLCAFIWGTAFVAQSAGSGMGAYSFLAGRSWLAVLVLIPTVFAFDTVRKKQGQPYGWPKEKSERKTLLAAGLVCGTFLFAASAAQQIGITINPSTAKAAFLTAMYVVLVPVFGLFLGRRGSVQLWVSMVIAVAGLYMLCMKNGFGGIETSDSSNVQSTHFVFFGKAVRHILIGRVVSCATVKDRWELRSWIHQETGYPGWPEERFMSGKNSIVNSLKPSIKIDQSRSLRHIDKRYSTILFCQ